ncbi:hypothetical protein KI809_15565 [Geobacter pelophilus]|uniref:Uncharacterized protein n=1 Tax=Geoanaerobacter pelophilus TaxID=60036 RepID=A0AAW4LC43_9BACT|nr:hypothetical protein [Geoanaerobacter pelophilus]MBT0664751.1 hypothetical protein [Geoanaerobacter pelophilus]MBT0665727.1 hypothetical protein [Geoanaerobacter pelophilus]
MPIADYDYIERVGIMEYCGRLNRRDAERLACERPWDSDSSWGIPKPRQMSLGEGTPAEDFFRMSWSK